MVICLVSAIREIWGNGTIWGYPCEGIVPVSGMLLPFSGFILLGFLASPLHKLRDRLISMDTSADTADFGYGDTERYRADAAEWTGGKAE